MSSKSGQRAATGPHVMRQMNAAAVLDAVRAASSSTLRVTDLAALTGLSRPAVTRALATLTEHGLVETAPEAPEAAGAVGRPAQHVRFRAGVGHVAGIDIGPHKVLVMVADLAGEVRATRRVAISPGTDGPRLFDTVRTALDDAVAEAGITPGDLWAVSVGTPGVVDPARGEVLLAPSIPGWAGLPVVPRLRDWLNRPVLIDNDVDLAVLGERWRGAATGADSVVFVQWGERIGAGIVIGGTPHRGASNAAGELGFVRLRPDTPTAAPAARPADQPGPDELGPFERLAGAAAIRGLAREAGVALGDGGDTAPLFDAARDGDPEAVAVVEQAAARFAHGLSMLVLLLDPGLVVIGGGLSRAGETLLEPVRRHLQRLTLVPTNLRASALGDSAVAVGALRRALTAAEARLTEPITEA